MAKILLVYYSDYGEAMYDALSKILIKNGNSVFRLNINNNGVQISSWGGESKIVDNSLLVSIKKFSPNIIFNFNNCLPINVFDVLKSTTKNCVIDADAPTVAFWNCDFAAKNVSALLFLGLQSCSKKMFEEILNIKLTRKKYIYFPPATIIQNKKSIQNKNISFIGSNFYPMEMPFYKDYFYSNDGLALASEFKYDYFYDFKKASSKYHCNIQQFYEVRAFYVGQERLKYLQSLTDLGLHIYGLRFWKFVASYDYDIASCFDPTPIRTIKENESIYNSSKISVNISHPLAKTSFSWRVMDIMASNSCLLMEYKPDWIDLFGKYISQKTLKSIIYKNRFDMRKKAIALLKNEKLRKSCVKELNDAIEKNGRLESRFASLEKFINIKILNLKNTVPKYIFIDKNYEVVKPKENVVSNNNLTNSTIVITPKKEKIKWHLQIKSRLKMMGYAFLMVAGQIPGFALLCFDKEKRKKLLNKIVKDWR